MVRRHRVIAGVLASIAILVTLVGCFEFPLGDPERSTIDTQYVGLWLENPAPGADGDAKRHLVAVNAYDSRTCLVTDMAFTKEGERYVPSEQFNYKMWVTKIDGVTFGTLEICDPAELVEKTEKFYLVLRLERAGDGLTATEIAEDFVKNANVTTSEGLAKLIAANLKNPSLFSKPQTFHKLGPARAEEANAILSAFARGK